MKIKRYFGPDTRQVMRNIRLEQGGDAVILSCRNTPEGTEIVTAIDDAPAAAPATPPPPAAAAPTTAPAPTPVPTPEATADGGRELELIRRELRAVQGLLEDRFARLEAVDFRQRNPLAAQLLRRLEERGFDPELARALASSVKATDRKRAWNEVLLRLSRVLPTTNDDVVTHGGRIVLHGASGVGKTTIAAKLVARYRLRHGRRKVALISTDTHRIGGSHQLKRYAELLQVPLLLAGDRDELAQALTRTEGCGLVLIDTAGGTAPETFAGLPELQHHIVTAASASASATSRSLSRLASLKPSAAIVTKLDEAEQLGEVLSLLVRHRLPIAYTSDGERIPEDLSPARSSRLVATAMTVARTAAKGKAKVA